MSNVLKNDRKESELRVLEQSEMLVKETFSIYNTENKLPKKQRPLIGARSINNILDSYENLRYANSLFPDTIVDIKARLNAGREAVKSASKFASDVNVLPEACRFDRQEKWFLTFQNHVIEYNNTIKKWQKTDTTRLNSKYQQIVDNKANKNTPS